VLLPHVLEDELKKVCQEMSNDELHESEFGCIMRTAQEVRTLFYHASLVKEACLLTHHFDFFRRS